MAIKFLNTVAVDTDVLYVDTTNDRVGIGTTSPSFPLHVNTSNDVVAYFKSSDNKASILLADDDTQAYLSAENGRLGFGTGNGVSANNITILQSNNNVGIGTTTPGTKLTINGGDDAAATGVLELTTSGGTNLKFGGNTGYSWIQSHASKPLYINQLGNNVILNLNGGNVGIGTTNPLSKFQVNGQASVLGNSFNGLAYFNGTNALASYNTANKIVMSSNGSTDGLYTGGLHLTRRALTQQGHFGSGIRGISVGTVLQDNALELYTSTNTEQNATRLKIASNGNVGIGTTAPSQLLHVAGNMRLQNQLYDSTNSIGTSGQVLTKTSAGTIWADNRGLAPTTPGGIVATIVGETIEIAFNQSTTSNIDYYQVWSSDDGGDYGIIGQIAPSDFSSTMTVVDTTFVTGGTMSYRVYAVKSGVYSPAGTVSKAYTVSALSVTNMTVVNLNTAYYIQYEKPLSRFIDHVEIYMDSQTTSAALNRSNASIVYSGQNASYMRNVGTNNNFHQFWVEIVTS
jgi:hypothetical protein